VPFDNELQFRNAWAVAHVFLLEDAQGAGESRAHRREEVTMGTAEELEQLIAPAVAAAGLEVVDVELLPGLVRVSVDAPQGVDIDGLGPLSRTISALLDDSGAAPAGHYDLEVSSPGLERSLRRPEHFRRALGQRVKVRTMSGSEGERRAEGLLAEATEQGVRLTDAELPGGERWLDYRDIERARTVFDWKMALAGAKPAAGGRARRERRRASVAPRADASSPSPSTTMEPGTGRERASKP
jgi:ribosome maturation factor RimP